MHGDLAFDVSAIEGREEGVVVVTMDSHPDTDVMHLAGKDLGAVDRGHNGAGQRAGIVKEGEAIPVMELGIGVQLERSRPDRDDLPKRLADHLGRIESAHLAAAPVNKVGRVAAVEGLFQVRSQTGVGLPR